MLFSNVFLAFAALVSFTSAAPIAAEKESVVLITRQAANIRAALLTAEQEAIKLRDAFSAATGTDPAEVDAIRAQNQVLLNAVNNCKTVTAASPALTLIEALGFATTVNRLQNTLDSALNVVAAKKPQVDQLGLTKEVHDTLVVQQTAVNDFGTVLLTKVPLAAKSIAQGYIDDFNASFNKAIAIYA